MILDREQLKYVSNILKLNNESDDGVNYIYDILTAIKENDNNAFLKTILKLANKESDLVLLDKVFASIKHNPDLEDDILDSFSDNQVKAKTQLVNHLDTLKILHEDTEVVIWGGWYGSVLIPLLHDKVKKITVIDADDGVIKIGCNQLFKDYDKVTWITDDIFTNFRDNYYHNCDIFINTSCEHMRPMKDWGPAGPKSKWIHSKFGKPDKIYSDPWWDRINPDAYFAFTSNNMHDIEGHINCVDTIEEFKLQLPDDAKVLIEDNLVDERGTRFMLIGKL